MKKVLIVSTHLPPFTGGAEQVAWQIASALKEKYEIHILTVGNRRFDECKKNIKIHYVPFKYPLSVYYSTYGKKHIDEIIAKNKFDLINIHTSLPWGYVLRNYPIKKIITEHVVPELNRKASLVNYFAMRFAFTVIP